MSTNEQYSKSSGNRRVIFGASMPVGLKYLKLLRQLKLGECVLTLLPADKDEALAVATYCKKEKIRLSFSEVLFRGTTEPFLPIGRKIPRDKFYSKKDLEQIVAAAGEYYQGRVVVCEGGGTLYWPMEYVIDRKAGDYINLPAAKTMDQAKNAFVAYLKGFVDFERKEIGGGPLMSLDCCMAFKYFAQAGVDAFRVESLPGDPHRMHAAVRGVARAYGKPWGSHIAIQCYGGMRFDELWLKRWKISLYHSYIAGAEEIYPESGHMDYDQRNGQKFGFHSKEMKSVRRTLREAHQFSRIHQRPSKGPKVRIGVVHGNLDGAPGMWNKFIWGQIKGKKWLAGPAENGWDLLDNFHRKQDWSNECVQGDEDSSGNPPCGQYDIVPIEAPLKILSSYSALIFLGWNTMTGGIYSKLKKYVEGGGHLVMNVPHLSTHTDRASDLKLYRRGDFSDLFGVKVLGKGKSGVIGTKCIERSSLQSYRFPFWRYKTDPRFLGMITPARVRVTTAKIISAHDNWYYAELEQLKRQPILVENSVGKGKAFLVTAWQYPGDDGIGLFYKDILRTVLAGEQDSIKVHSSDRVRYAIYEDKLPRSKKYSVIYMLNTDLDSPSPASISNRKKKSGVFHIPACELRMAFGGTDIFITPENKCTGLKSWKATKNRHVVEVFSLKSQRVEIHNIGRSQITGSVNGVRFSCQPEESCRIRIKKRIDPNNKEFYANNFLDEPSVQYEYGRTPY